jgi:hypothetical protein
VKEGDLVILYALPDEVVERVDVLRPGMVLGVLGQGLSTLIVDVERDQGVWLKVQLGKQMS